MTLCPVYNPKKHEKGTTLQCEKSLVPLQSEELVQLTYRFAQIDRLHQPTVLIISVMKHTKDVYKYEYIYIKYSSFRKVPYNPRLNIK